MAKLTGTTINRFRVAQAMNATSAKSARQDAINIRTFTIFGISLFCILAVEPVIRDVRSISKATGPRNFILRPGEMMP